MKMKRLFSAFTSLAQSAAGFTMIELLVVIAVIGVLAVAVLSSIDPIEQINKGRDTRKRSNAAQLINAVDRFYAIQEKYPWNEATYATELNGTDSDPAEGFPDGTACVDNGQGFCLIGGPDYTTPVGWLGALSQTAEVKESFINQLENESSTNELFVMKRDISVDPTADDSVYVCFLPASKQFQLEALDGCSDRQALLPASACPQADYSNSPAYADEMICLP